MKIKKNLVLIGLILLIGAGCSKEDPSVGVKFKEFSLRAPSGPGWRVFKKDAHSVTYVKKESEIIIFSVVARSQKIEKDYHSAEEFLADRIKAKTQVDPKEYKVLKYDMKPDTRFGEYAVSFHFISEDIRMVKTKGMRVEMIGYIVLHPKDKHQLLDITVLKRYPQELENADFLPLAEEIFKGYQVSS